MLFLSTDTDSDRRYRGDILTDSDSDTLLVLLVLGLENTKKFHPHFSSNYNLISIVNAECC